VTTANNKTAVRPHLALFLLTVVYAFNFIDRQILVILQEPIKQDMGLSDTQLGLLSGFSFALVYVLAGIPIAYLADRGNRRNIIAIALTIWSGMTAISGLAQNYTHLLLARIGVGLGEAGGSPPSHSMISDYYAPEHRGKAMSFYSTGIYIGILFGFALGGILADELGWRMAFFVVGIPGVLFAGVLMLLLKEPVRGSWDAGADKNAKASFKETLTFLMTRKSFWYAALGTAMMSYKSYGNGNFMPSFLYRLHDMSLSEIGFTLALVSGVAGAVGTFMGGVVADKLGAKDKRWYLWTPMWGAIIALPLGIYVLLTLNTQSLIIALVLSTVTSTLYLGPCIAISHALVPPHMRAMTSAVLFFILNMIGLGLGPLLTGLLSDWFTAQHGVVGLRYAMLSSYILGSSAIILFFMAGRHLLNDLAQLEALRDQ
jgi:predicted MFS family arabinose efflux permease